MGITLKSINCYDSWCRNNPLPNSNHLLGEKSRGEDPYSPGDQLTSSLVEATDPQVNPKSGGENTNSKSTHLK